MERQIIDTYVNTGKVKMVYNHFIVVDAIPGGESFRAAEASECAADQGRFWDYHDVLFANQTCENCGNYSDARLKLFATQLSGLDLEKFNSCFDGRTHKGTVEASNALALSRQVTATPTLFVVGPGDRRFKVNNPLDFAEVQRLIEQELAQAGGQ